MARKKERKLTRFEMQIMGALWEIGQASVREIQERLPKRDRPAYTTVQTIVRRLQEKGAVRLVKTIGNAFIFEPAITRKAAHRRLIDDLLEMFGGSARPVMAHLAESGKLTLEDVRQIDEMLSEQAAEAERDVPSAKIERQI